MGIKKWLVKRKGKKAVNNTTDFHYNIVNGTHETWNYPDASNSTTTDLSKINTDCTAEQCAIYRAMPDIIIDGKVDVIPESRETVEKELEKIAETKEETKPLKKLPIPDSGDYQELINEFFKDNPNKKAIWQGKRTKLFNTWLENEGYEVDE